MCITLYLLHHLLLALVLQALQNHYHPEVAKAAAVLNQSLSEMEDDISRLLELSAYEVTLLCLCEWLEPEESGLVPVSCSPTMLLGGRADWLWLPRASEKQESTCSVAEHEAAGWQGWPFHKGLCAGSFRRLEQAVVPARVKSLD